jgi:hypothetical protein
LLPCKLIPFCGFALLTFNTRPRFVTVCNVFRSILSHASIALSAFANVMKANPRCTDLLFGSVGRERSRISPKGRKAEWRVEALVSVEKPPT